MMMMRCNKIEMTINERLKEGYEYQIKVFGREIQSLIEHRKVLLVGAGALGCEFLKLFALMGLATKGL
jgi:ubiquitin-activating enzyme E1